MSMFHELMMKKKGMPERYQEVEYIENNSDTSGAYIDTGYKASSNTRLVVKCTLNASAFSRAGGHQLAGSDNGLTTQFGVGTALSQQTYRFQYGVSKIDGGASISPDTITIFDQNKNKCYIDGNLFYTFSVRTFNCSENTLLFTRTIGSTSANWNGKVYYCQIYDNDRLVRNFIPVYDTLTNKYGMWESVHGKFYGNDGTGDFGGSIVGYTVVGSPTITDGVVSGFSSANYLKINVPTAINYNVFELNIKFKTSDRSVYHRLIWNSNNLLFVISSGILSLNFFNTNNTWYSLSGGSIVNNTWYWYKIKFDIVNKTMIADRSTDGINFTNVLSESNLQPSSSIKITTNGILFCDQDNSGNITLDLNSTNIKINNKLWFNGQPS